MNHKSSFIAYALPATAILLTAGCSDTQTGGSATADPTEGSTTAEISSMPPHDHAGGDVLVWPIKEEFADLGVSIWFGHHGDHFHGGEKIEPAVAIMKGDEAVSDATVRVSLVGQSEDGNEIQGEVRPTVFEPKTEHEIAHYAQGKLKSKFGDKQVTIRFSVMLPGSKDPIERDMNLKLGH